MSRSKSARLVGCVCAGLSLASPAAAFSPNDPLAPNQWYLSADHAFDAWPTVPTLQPVKVAVVDSGIDGSHPEFVGKIAAARSFVGGSPLIDTNGHGTFVAGEIAASVSDGVGTAGMAPAAELVIAKVTGAGGDISQLAEARAIRWSVDVGARVINLSFGGLRDPGRPHLDTYSALEADAVRYAIAHHVVVVAAVGNSTAAPRTPWLYADYPAALPHVIGVSALTRTGDVPSFSNRDTRFNEIAAPGVDILSTLPLALTGTDPSCPNQGYSNCGPIEFRNAIGTSFAAPQVAAAAADLLGIDPTLFPDQVSWLLERTAHDVNPSTGCSICSFGRDAVSGWGSLDVSAAVAALLAHRQPPPDAYDPNDDTVRAYPLWGSYATITGTVDFWQNPHDVYRTYLHHRQTLNATFAAPSQTQLSLWRPGTPTIVGPDANTTRYLESRTRGTDGQRSLRFTATKSGWYYIEAGRDAPGAGIYTLTITKSH